MLLTFFTTSVVSRLPAAQHTSRDSHLHRREKFKSQMTTLLPSTDSYEVRDLVQ